MWQCEREKDSNDLNWSHCHPKKRHGMTAQRTDLRPFGQNLRCLLRFLEIAFRWFFTGEKWKRTYQLWCSTSVTSGSTWLNTSITGWWFGCHVWKFPINIWVAVLPIDEVHHFSGRGGYPKHQPGLEWKILLKFIVGNIYIYIPRMDSLSWKIQLIFFSPTTNQIGDGIGWSTLW